MSPAVMDGGRGGGGRKTRALAIFSGGAQRDSALSPRFPQRSFTARRQMRLFSFLSFLLTPVLTVLLSPDMS